MLIHFRITAGKVGLSKLAEKIQEYNFHALLVIGGYEVSESLGNNDVYRYFF